MIPQGFIQDLLTRVDIVDVVGRYVQLKKGGQNFMGLCPFHGEKTPSFTVSPSKQFFHCFGCGAHGSAISFLMDHRGLGFVDAVKELAQQAGMQVPESAADANESAAKSRGLSDLLQKAGAFYQTQLRLSDTAKDYLKGRGLTGQTALRFGIGYSPDAWQSLREAFDSYDDARLVEAGLVIADEGKRYDRFRGRVMFPIRNRRGVVIGFGARVLDGGEPKYLNSPETPVFRKGQELYGLFEAQEAIRTRKRAIVCEGYMDVIQLAQAGFQEAVAALGTAITAAHVGTLLRLTDHVIFAFDGDAAGRKAARRALEATLPMVGDAKRASFVLLPDGEDPDSLIQTHGPGAFEDELSKAMPLSGWLVRSLSDDKDLSKPEDRAAFLAQAKPLLETMPASALRLQLTQELAQAARASTDQVENLFGLRPWRRLPASNAAARVPRLAPEVSNLKERVLQYLLVAPELAREFNSAIVTEFVDAHEQGELEQRIAKVWRAATQSQATNSAALLDELANQGEDVAGYWALVRREDSQEADCDGARAEIAGALAQLRKSALERRRNELLAEFERTRDPDTLRAYQVADREYMQAKSASAGDGTG